MNLFRPSCSLEEYFHPILQVFFYFSAGRWILSIDQFVFSAEHSILYNFLFILDIDSASSDLHWFAISVPAPQDVRFRIPSMHLIWSSFLGFWVFSHVAQPATSDLAVFCEYASLAPAVSPFVKLLCLRASFPFFPLHVL